MRRRWPLEAALARGVVGVDANADHLAAWRLDTRGNPIGNPRRFAFDLSGSASHRDARGRHALSRLLRWATTHGARAVAVNAVIRPIQHRSGWVQCQSDPEGHF
ncbi:hypothetical protein [Nocardiopsis akebiae]|uniref:hypothetical protein n=1 Tax=Nocardiopsis akebiae TaxID=2831968 RepID=UPI0020163AF9|nr:hypothetical protein [Nocardiopsis akebiae]